MGPSDDPPTGRPRPAFHRLFGLRPGISPTLWNCGPVLVRGRGRPGRDGVGSRSDPGRAAGSPRAASGTGSRASSCPRGPCRTWPAMAPGCARADAGLYPRWSWRRCAAISGPLTPRRSRARPRTSGRERSSPTQGSDAPGWPPRPRGRRPGTHSTRCPPCPVRLPHADAGGLRRASVAVPGPIPGSRPGGRGCLPAARRGPTSASGAALCGPVRPQPVSLLAPVGIRRTGAQSGPRGPGLAAVRPAEGQVRGPRSSD